MKQPTQNSRNSVRQLKFCILDILFDAKSSVVNFVYNENFRKLI